MLFEIKWARGFSGRVIRVSKRVFCWFRWVVKEVAAALGAGDGGESARLGRRKRLNDDIFDPVGMVTRTAAILEPCAGAHPRVLGLLIIRRVVVHRAVPQTMRTL